MKRFAILFVCAAMLVCATACFKSEKKPETSAAPTLATTAPSATVSTAATSASAAGTTVASGSLDSFPCVGYTTDSLNVRRDASTDYDAIGGLEKGDKVTIVGEEGDFYKIEWSSFDGNFEGQYAYVSKQYVSATPNGDTPTVASTTGAPVSDPTSAAKTTVPTKPVVQA
ncbi:MAG: SH3 domain-containing protein [Clostridia bacterium]|nr:SH3 domain-containing protein [Clostridia bacterium]